MQNSKQLSAWISEDLQQVHLIGHERRGVKLCRFLRQRLAPPVQAA
jgi:hypothetical protein